MKKYKLIKEYPGSPKLGAEVLQDCENNYNLTNQAGGYFHKKYIENQSEFWQEITKPEYTILSFIKRNTLYKVCEDGNLLWDTPEYKNITKNPGATHWSKAIENGYSIHSVRRESDSEIFTIGDTITWGAIDGFECKITGFKIENCGYGKLHIITTHLNQPNCHVYLDHYNLHKVKPKEWEIIAFRNIKSQQLWKDCGASICGKNGYWYTLFRLSEKKHFEELIKDFEFEIHSIKRLSDGVKFKIGDKVDRLLTYKDGEEILSFEMRNNNLCVNTTHGSSNHITSIQHRKQLLFITEDGVEVFEGDEFYFVGADWNYFLYSTKQELYSFYKDSLKVFSTKEKAEEYILMNKPCLSIKDLQNLQQSCGGFKISRIFFGHITTLVNQKLKQ